MENKEYEIYNIKCDWDMGENYDAVGKNNNSWSGKMLVRERDGSIKGYVCDDDKKELSVTHAIIGTYAQGAGISVLKLDLKGYYDPIAFTGLLKKDLGIYRGHFNAVTAFGNQRLGVSKIYVEEDQSKEKNCDELNDYIDNLFKNLDQFETILIENNGEKTDHTEIRKSLKTAFEEGFEA